MRHLLVDHLRHKLFCPQRAFAQKVLRGAKQVRYWERVYEAGAPVKQKSASFALGPQASQRSGR